MAMHLLLHPSSDNPPGHTIICDSKDQPTWGGTSPLSPWEEGEQEALRGQHNRGVVGGQHNRGVVGPGGPGNAVA